MTSFDDILKEKRIYFNSLRRNYSVMVNIPAAVPVSLNQ